METSVPGGDADTAQGSSTEAEFHLPRPDTFVLRLAARSDGALAGVIQHVRTSERRPFEGLRGLGEAIQALTGDDHDRRKE